MARVITSYAGPEIEMEDAWLQDRPYLKPSKSNNAPMTNIAEISERGDDRLARFQCKICLETASEAVVTPCGHLFCWPCIYTWISRSSKSSDECPVCKGYVSRDNLIPIYGEGQSPERRRGRDDIPPRPKARREEKYGGKVHHRHASVRQQSRSRALPLGQTLC